ncbi:hypothetical protein [Arthrobacter cupressi]
MDTPNERTPELLPAPRHLHRRRFRRPVPEDRFVELPVQPVPPPQPTNRAAKPEKRPSSFGRKRLVALAVVAATTLAVPALILALLFIR